MHIHANNNLQLATLGSLREEVHEIQAKRAAEVRKKLSTAAHANVLGEDEFSSGTSRVEARSYESESRQGQSSAEEDGFGRLFSAKA